MPSPISSTSLPPDLAIQFETQGLGLLERYREIVGDWDAFAEATLRPHRPTVWANPLRVTSEELAAWLKEDGFGVEPMAWHPGGFRLPAGASPGYSLAYFLGLYHVQEETSMMPVVLLDPQPGERVLDLCAAPGNKTAQIAVRVGEAGGGMVFACEIDNGRIGLIRRTLNRLGIVNVAVARTDAGNLSPATGLFDRTLVDVPCSCEGTVRKNPSVMYRYREPDWRQTTQVALLRKAVQLTKPGGRIVYSTCTYAPEENEGVLDTVLREAPPGRVRLVEARIPGVRSAPGLREWDGHRFVEGVEKAMRIYPHLNDTGGFFVAVLERGDELDPRVLEAQRPRRPVTVALADRRAAAEPELTWVEERFGISRRVLEEGWIYRQNSKTLSRVDRNLELPPKPESTFPVGLPLFRAKTRAPRFKHAGAVSFGALATRNAVDLDREQVQVFLDEGQIRPRAEQMAGVTGHGVLLLRYRGVAFTYAHTLAEDQALVVGHVPKLWARLKTRRSGDLERAAGAEVSEPPSEHGA